MQFNFLNLISSHHKTNLYRFPISPIYLHFSRKWDYNEMLNLYLTNT